ncbi:MULTISPECIES: thioesterase family protein [unclassified Beijerinckia]|uniref:acyl-CoA thioesterase n=1 Tax=unclassified Beijerinckia TaxID=2638183 RepID=UPI0008963253|nr:MULTISPECIES: thioesterase family protein [unclassified Beijerinckia]MDH7797582.1 acyl-CoA thioesterase FadM [Beijerinckia sp. GAS462]SEC91320.1 4-hydroxybenzoyl-CoA thioesterase/acyl-CoA thioester hydrolase [Beijerinckia sp. 28-YEA-48]
MPRFVPLPLSSLPASVWRTSFLIRFGDCDPAGIVYTPEYFNIFNGVIEDWYSQSLGFPYHLLIGQRRMGLGYAHVSADFSQPSSMGEVLEAAIIVKNIGRSSVALSVHAFKAGLECVRANFVTVTTSLRDHAVIPIPDDLRRAFETYRQGCNVPELTEGVAE